MISTTNIVVATIAIAAALVGYLIYRPAITVSRGGKILAFVAVFIFPTLAGSMGFSEHMERSKRTEFCTSCHVMKDYGKSLHVDDPSYIPAAHFQNNRVPREEACYTCHTDYAMFGGVRAKLRGMRHLYIQYLGKAPDKIELYSPYNNRECLHCHNGARNFEEGATHNAEDERLDQIKANKLSCLTSGCHETTHNVKGLGNVNFWSTTAGAHPSQEATSDNSTGKKGEER